MKDNLTKFYGLVNSQRVMLTLTQKGVSRENAYEIVQRCAMKSWNKKIDFFTTLSNDDEVVKVLSKLDLENCFDDKFHLKNIDKIFKRVFS